MIAYLDLRIGTILRRGVSTSPIYKTHKYRNKRIFYRGQRATSYWVRYSSNHANHRPVFLLKIHE